MVVLNLTILVEVGLFLIFVWAMNRFVFRPLFRVMDDRDAKTEDDRATALSEGERAERMEKQYAAKVSAIHREASQRVLDVHRAAQQEHNERIASLKETEDRELTAVRAEAERLVAAERPQYPALTTGLADAVAGRLGLGGEAP